MKQGSLAAKLYACLMALICLCALAAPVQAQDGDDLDPALANGPKVENVRIGYESASKKKSSRTRIVLDLSENVDYRWFTLPQPARMVVDFSPVTFVPELTSLPLPEGSLVKGMRAGTFRPGTVRMVLDLKKQSRISMFTIPGGLSKGPRVVIDVITPRPGEKPTDVAPPPDVVTTEAAPSIEAIQGKPNSNPAPVVPRQVVQDRKGPVVITLDAGHGGVDPGACSRDRFCEKGLTLKMAKKIGARLNNLGYKIIYTRDRDTFIPLPERVAIAQRAQADLFVSLHADSHPSKRSVRGATVYMVSEKASDREAARLADNENEGDIVAGIALGKESKEVQSILISLVQRETLNGSAYLGQSVLEHMGRMTSVRKKQVLSAGFRVLKAPDIPSILVEMGYLSNPREEALLKTQDYQDKLAAAIASGIHDYVRAHIHTASR